MGLHQTHATSDGVGSDEAHERFKVFKSLYIRDKSLSISRGSICWLPSFDCSFKPEVGQSPFSDGTCSSRIQLAGFQEEIYKLFHSAESQRQTPAKHKSALKRIEQSLERWAKVYDVFGSPGVASRPADLQLEFLATRISAFRGSLETSHINIVLTDARASCLLLLISYGKQTQSLIQRLELLPLSMSPSASLGKTAGPRPGSSRKSRSGSSVMNAGELAIEPSSTRLRSLLDTFSVPAFFFLAKHIILSLATPGATQVEDDIDLLLWSSTCYKEMEVHTEANNYTRKVGRAFEHLIEVITIYRASETVPSSTTSVPQDNSLTTASPPSSLNMQDPFISSNNFSEFIDPPFNISNFTQDAFNTNSNSAGTADDSSTGASPGLLTPLDTEFIGQQHFESLQQFSISPRSRKRCRPNNTQVVTGSEDFTNSKLVFGFLDDDAMISF
jgi:hypothetical protein